MEKYLVNDQKNCIKYNLLDIEKHLKFLKRLFKINLRNSTEFILCLIKESLKKRLRKRILKKYF